MALNDMALVTECGIFFSCDREHIINKSNTEKLKICEINFNLFQLTFLNS